MDIMPLVAAMLFFALLLVGEWTKAGAFHLVSIFPLGYIAVAMDEPIMYVFAFMLSGIVAWRGLSKKEFA